MANLYVGNKRPDNIHCGNTQVYRIYAGDTLVWQYIPPTTTTTTTLSLVNFDMSYICTGSNATITINNFAGGSGFYQANTTPQTSIANAFSGSFMDVSSSYNYTNISNGTWYVVLRDKYNTSNAQYNVVSFTCVPTTTTTTTTPPSGAGYYDCGYGCQYYLFDPGCTPCSLDIQGVYIYNYSSDITINSVYVGSNQLNGSFPLLPSNSIYADTSTGVYDITVYFNGGSNPNQSIYINDSNNNLTCWDYDSFSTNHVFSSIYITNTSTISIYAVSGSCV